ncbi:Uncharacterised protein [uncultured archaeon]|nr:Uncharacterised protein [uncultured archaeon]
MDNLNFYRGIGLPEYRNYKENGFVFSEREWVELGLEKEGGFRFLYIKKTVDVGGWKEGVNSAYDMPRDIIIRVSGLPETEFVRRMWHVPARYINRVNIDFSRATIVYDPRGIITGSPLELNEKSVPELKEFHLEHMW